MSPNRYLKGRDTSQVQLRRTGVQLSGALGQQVDVQAGRSAVDAKITLQERGLAMKAKAWGENNAGLVPTLIKLARLNLELAQVDAALDDNDRCAAFNIGRGHLLRACSLSELAAIPQTRHIVRGEPWSLTLAPHDRVMQMMAKRGTAAGGSSSSSSSSSSGGSSSGSSSNLAFYEGASTTNNVVGSGFANTAPAAMGGGLGGSMVNDDTVAATSAATAAAPARQTQLLSATTGRPIGLPLDSPAASEAEAADRVMQLVTCLSELGTYLLHKATWRSDDDHQSEALRLFEQAHMLCAESNLPSLGPHSSQARDALDNKAYLASQLMERREAICFPNARHTLHATNRTLDTLLGAGAADAAAMANVASNKRLQALQAKRCELNARYKQGPDALTMQREGEKYPPVAVPGQKKARLEAVARLTAPRGAAVGDIHQPGAAGRAARAVAAGAGGAPTALEWEEVTGLTVQVLANKEGHLGPDHPSLADVLERLARSLFLEAVAMRREHFEAKKRERGHGGVKAGAADKGGRVAAVKKKALSSSGPVSPIEKEKAKRARQRKAQKAKQDRILAPPPPTPWERRWEVAAIVLERALTLIQSSYNVKMNTRALVLQDLLAEVYYWLGRYEEADQLFFKSLQARSVLFDPEIGEASDPDNSDSDRSSDSDSDRGSGSGSDNGSERGCDDREASHGDDGGRGGKKLFGAMSMKSKKGSSRKQRGGRPGPGMTHPGRNGKPQGGRGGRSGGKSGGKGKSSGGSGGRSGRRGDAESGGGGAVWRHNPRGRRGRVRGRGWV